MGAGLAREFRHRFPRMHADYIARCARGELHIGVVTTFRERGKLIINVPTKHHWRDRSRLEDIEAGLRALRRLLLNSDIPSIAVPALGCELRWGDVESRIRAALGTVPGVEVALYLPREGTA